MGHAALELGDEHRVARRDRDRDAALFAAGVDHDVGQIERYEVRVGKFPFAALGRAMAVHETDGFFKVVANKKTNELLGVDIVGAEASDLMSEAALALEMHAFLEDIVLTILPHPTSGEGMMEAAMNASAMRFTF